MTSNRMCGSQCPKCLKGELKSFQPNKGDSYYYKCSQCQELFADLIEKELAHGIPEFQDQNR